jgi:hypothetical protein
MLIYTDHNGRRRHLNTSDVSDNTKLYQFLEVLNSNLDLDIAYVTVFFFFGSSSDPPGKFWDIISAGHVCFLSDSFQFIVYQQTPLYTV